MVPLQREDVSEIPSWELPGDSRDADLFGWAPVVKPSAEKADQRPNLNCNQWASPTIWLLCLPTLCLMF